MRMGMTMVALHPAHANYFMSVYFFLFYQCFHSALLFSSLLYIHLSIFLVVYLSNVPNTFLIKHLAILLSIKHYPTFNLSIDLSIGLFVHLPIYP